MNINFDVAEILKVDLESVVPYLFVTSPRDHRERDRVYEKHESQYRMLKWLSWQFNGINIIDIGTRAGTSAFCLADNPANKVITCDINSIYKQVDIRPFLDKRGIEFIEQPATNIATNVLLKCPIISLDISHNGIDEADFLNRLDSIGYDGIVIMDDVNFPRKFPALQHVWNKIKIPKLLLPRKIAHDTGTGIVIYGPHAISVTLPPTES